MANTQIERRASRERGRLTRLLRGAGVSEGTIALLAPVIKNTAWMEVKLEDARRTIAESQVAISYDNGGGQQGIRENPLYRGYEALWRSYMAGVRQIVEVMPTQAAAQVTDTAAPTVLSLIRARHEADG